METALAGRIALWPKAVRGVQVPRISLDGTWKFSMTAYPEDHIGRLRGEEPFRNEVDFTHWSDVQVPGELALQGFDIEADKPYAYKRRFAVPKDYHGCAIFLRFEGVQSSCEGMGQRRSGRQSRRTGDDLGLRHHAGGCAGRAIRSDRRDRGPGGRSGDPESVRSPPDGGILRSVTLLARPAIDVSQLHVDAR